MIKFKKNVAGNSNDQSFNGSSPTTTPDTERFLSIYLNKHSFIFFVWSTLLFCTIYPHLASDYLDFVDGAQDWVLTCIEFGFSIRVLALSFFLYILLMTRDFFLFMSFNNNNIPSALTLHLRSLIFLLLEYFYFSTFIFVFLSLIPFVLFPKWLGMGAFQENISQIKLNDFSIFLEWFPLAFTEILMLIPISIFILWSTVTRRKGFLLYLRYNSLNLICALAFIIGYHYLASHLSFSIFGITTPLVDIYQVSYPSLSIFDLNWPPIIIIVYFIVATSLYFYIAWRNIRQAVSRTDKIYFHNTLKRPTKIQKKISAFTRKIFYNIWLILLCCSAVFLWNYYEGWTMHIPS